MEYIVEDLNFKGKRAELEKLGKIINETDDGQFDFVGSLTGVAYPGVIV